MKFLPLAFAALLPFSQSAPSAPFKIEVVDQENGWPVPLVELTTTHNVTFVTDNAGVVAIDEPELLGRETWFGIWSDGYEVPADGFGNRGVRLTPAEDQFHRIAIQRTQVAKRLGRLTGGGIFAESQKLGEHADWQESGVFGCDSVQVASYQGKTFWAWGDTNLPNYPLGIFHMTSATTPAVPSGLLRPPIKLRYDYFRDGKGNPRSVAEFPGDGPTWINSYVSLPDSSGTEHLVGNYVKIRGSLTAYRTGQCVWNDATENFEPTRTFWEESEQNPEAPYPSDGHPAFWTGPDGKRWLFFGDPFPRLKMPATFEAWQDPAQWETLTPQARVAPADGGPEITPHRGSIAWNGFRKKWVSVFTQLHGSPSPLGELWYAEADHPTGPWGRAVKVVSHEKYTVYNPRLHAGFTPEDSPVLLFEATYTSTFSNSPTKTPRYDYNQVLYRIDLDGPAFGN